MCPTRSTQVCSDKMATPKPGAHISLTASLLDISEPPASVRTISSRLPTCSFTLTFGFWFAKVTGNGGSKHSTVVTVPAREVLANTPQRRHFFASLAP